jgi:hypothetical protein
MPPERPGSQPSPIPSRDLVDSRTARKGEVTSRSGGRTGRLRQLDGEAGS